MRILAAALIAVAACKASAADLAPALQAALQRGDAAEVDRLLDQGASPNDPVSVDGRTQRPLGVAAQRGDVPVLDALLAHGADPGLKDPDGLSYRTALGNAAVRGQAAAAKRLLAAGARVEDSGGEMTPLALAADKGDLATVEALLAAGARVDPAPDATGYPPLAVAGETNLAVVRRLVEAGAPVDRRDKLGNTALFHATVKDRRDIAEYLLARGASPMVPNRAGWTPAFAASYNGHTEIRALFEKAGVTDWNLQQPPKDPPSGWGTVSIPVVEVQGLPAAEGSQR